MHKWTTEEVKEKIKEIHGEDYDTSLVEYINYDTKFTLICKKHGEFQIDFNHIMRGQGCPVCRYEKSSKSNTKSLEETIQKANEIHNNKYDYSLITDYKDRGNKYKIICPTHGVFEQTFKNHLKGQGCPICGKELNIEHRRYTLEEFIAKAKDVHGDKYDYSNSVYRGSSVKILISCPEHGYFWQIPKNHLYGQGCPMCGNESSGNKQALTTDEFIAKAKEVHGDRYDYSKVDYTNIKTKVVITCKKHGNFEQLPYNHLSGNGCPKCMPLYSNKEEEVYNFIKDELGISDVIHRERTILNGQELDICCPGQKIAIEFDGLFWHCETKKDKNYHLNKTEECFKQGYRLIHIFEDEWNFKQDIVKSLLRNIFNKTENRIYARNCVIKEIDGSISNKFLEENHVQGKCSSTIKIGLFYNDELVSLMTFGKSRYFKTNCKSKYELLRFCNKLNTSVIGGASKLFKYFINEYKPSEIITFADRRFSIGGLYNKLGFTLDHISRPGYYYVVRNRRSYRFNFRKSELVKKYGCPNDMSEHEFCLSQGIYRIYDCGNLCYKWTAVSND